MVVGEDGAACIVLQRALDHFPGVDAGLRCRSDEQPLARNHPVLRVQPYGKELLGSLAGQLQLEIVGHGLRVRQRLAMLAKAALQNLDGLPHYIGFRLGQLVREGLEKLELLRTAARHAP